MLEQELKEKLLVLCNRAWEKRARWTEIKQWLENFDGQTAAAQVEREHALFLLSQFMYFGSRELRELLRALYRDLFRYPIIEKIRRSNNDSSDLDLIRDKFREELRHTRFLGVGNPAESGVHLLYYFRQENGLPTDLFLDSQRLFKRTKRWWFGFGRMRLRDPSIRRYVFIDDICGSGQQAYEYSEELLRDLVRLNPQVEVKYLSLFATSTGLERIRKETLFKDNVGCIFELDESFQCFSSTSRYFLSGENRVSKATAEKMSRHYGGKLWPQNPLGYRNGQLLIGFHHNTPDNTLPIVWTDSSTPAWAPIFRRYPKVYSLAEK